LRTCGRSLVRNLAIARLTHPMRRSNGQPEFGGAGQGCLRIVFNGCSAAR
jgi:hypothetical protein